MPPLTSLVFDSWGAIGRILVVGALAYVTLVLMLRVSGKRTLAKFNAFDFVVTVALGSTLATVLLDDSITWSEGVTAFALLIGLQYVVAWLSVRSSGFRTMVRSVPALLMHRGRFLDDAMRRERVTRDEVLAALRSKGLIDHAEAAAVVIESNGDLVVLTDLDAPTERSTVHGSVRGGDSDRPAGPVRTSS